MPEKILRAIFVLLFTVLGIVLSRQGETVLALLLPNSVLTETILGITFMSLAAMLVGGIFGAIIGSFISPYLIKSLFMFTSTVEGSHCGNPGAVFGSHYCKPCGTGIWECSLYRAICFRSFEYYSRLSWNALGGQ